MPVMLEPGEGALGSLAPQYPQISYVTLFQPRRAYYPHLLLLPPFFLTFRHDCKPVVFMGGPTQAVEVKLKICLHDD